MSGVEMSWDTSGAERKVAAWIRKMGDLRGILPAIGEILHTSVAENFDRGETPDGRRWKPSKRVLLHGGKTLVDHGILRDSFFYAITGPTDVTLATSVEYAAIHNFGGMAGRGRKVRMPARTFLGIRKEDLMDINTTLTRFFEEG